MGLNDQATLYDVLDIKPDASPQEVREAYLRTKSAYNKDSVALYTLISPDEREETIRLIEEAYEVLSNTERRKEYDRYHGLLSPEEELLTHSRPGAGRKIISIDRVPPMEDTSASDDLLVAPSTDFTSAGPSRGAGSGTGFFGATEAPLSPFRSTGEATARQTAAPAGTASPVAQTPPPAQPQAAAPPPAPQAAHAEPPPHKRASSAGADTSLMQEIAREVDWQGLFLRKVREARRISIEEMSAVTKVSKTYLIAIEDENYAKLPAPVFLRGFIIQIAKLLKLPHEQVSAAYMARFHAAKPDKDR